MEGLTSNALKIINSKIAAEKKSKANLTKVNKISSYYKPDTVKSNKVKANVSSGRTPIINHTIINNSHKIEQRVTPKVIDFEVDHILRQSDIILANQPQQQLFQSHDGNEHLSLNYVDLENDKFDDIQTSDYSSDEGSDNESNTQIRADHWLASKKETSIPFYLQSFQINSNYSSVTPFYIITDQQKKDFNHFINDLVLNELLYNNGIFWLNYATNGPNAKELKELFEKNCGMNGYNLQCNSNINKDQTKIQQIRQNKATKSVLNIPTRLIICVCSKKICQKNTKDNWFINLSKMKGNIRYNWNCTLIAIYYFSIFFMKFVKCPIVLHLEDLKFRTYFMLQQSFMKHIICNNVNIK